MFSQSLSLHFIPKSLRPRIAAGSQGVRRHRCSSKRFRQGRNRWYLAFKAWHSFTFNSHPVDIAPLLKQLQNFSLLSLNSFLHSFFKSKFMKKSLTTEKCYFQRLILINKHNYLEQNTIVHEHSWLSGSVIGWFAIHASSIRHCDGLLLFQNESDSSVTHLFRSPFKKGV